ncbi:MAG: hypothetical protein NT000_08530 [Proteobacteria bacterium]|nr:hypothetical protein [Pseudomonadota bacterium]
MIKNICRELDRWLIGENRERVDSGTLLLRCEIHIIGQTALLEARLGIRLAATMDVDLHEPLEGAVREKLDELLAVHGKKIDPVGHEAWMPKETQFNTIYTGKFLKSFVAQPEYVLISKAKMAPKKNKNLIIEYLGTQPTPLFLQLAKKYEINLEEFLK